LSKIRIVLSIVIQNKTVKSKFKIFFSLQIRRNSQIMIKQQLEMRRKSIAEDCNLNEIDNHQENNENTTANHGTLDEHIENLKQLLKSRDAEINKLKREIHKLKVFTNNLMIEKLNDNNYIYLYVFPFHYQFHLEVKLNCK
jgi:hypothetical protein